ncbi:MAG: hypothetical protein J1F66_00370 [Clostridiales bacterium]|nr:hypothetical protein [Clostridiales bacterium]
MSVCIVSFSSRKGGNSSQISGFIKSQLPDAKIYNFADFSINACVDCEYQCFNGGSNCPYFNDKECEILDAITNSTLTYFIVPNYCDFPCSNFFVFNERSLCYFQNNEQLLTRYLKTPKKFIVISNGNIENFQTAFSYHTEEMPGILSLSAKKYGKESINGDILTSEQAVADLKHFITK